MDRRSSIRFADGSSHSHMRYSTSYRRERGYEEGSGGTTGIVNIGNTCFMNSILQCLSNTKALRDFCLSSRYRDELNPNSKMRGNLLNGFVDVIRQLWSNDQMVVSPKHFRTQIQKFSPRFLGNDQQDSQEFLRFLLEGLHEEINQVRRKSRDPIPDMDDLRAREKAQKTWEWYKGKDDSFIFDMFVGQLESALKCKECNHTSLTYDPFWDLSVPVNKIYSSGEVTMTDCLHSFTKEETLDYDEKPFCDRCKTRRRMTKKLSIYKFPPVLVLHLKRFSEGSRFRQKLSHLVKFPLSGLDLTPFASKHYEDETPPVYDLYAVSNHIGSCYGGHYTAYCCNPVTQQWNSFNDSSVKQMSETGACTKEAYVLFYQLRSRRNSRL